jgi:hypothetical protein
VLLGRIGGSPMRWPLSIFSLCRSTFGLALLVTGAAAFAQPSPSPSPMIDESHPVDWVFAFKFNAADFPTTAAANPCLFGGTAQAYVSSQKYALAYSGSPTLQDGPGLIGTSPTDPVGATFAKIYAAGLNFVVWNDQFYRHPPINGCSESCGGPWGHSKGVIAWNSLGEGVVMQVTTPSWPGSGTFAAPRSDDGNTLGCVSDDDVKASQHFFALRLSPADTAAVLDALLNASVVTDVTNAQLARIGGPSALQQRASALGRKSTSKRVIDVTLSSGVRLISKPSALHVPPWQLVSAQLGRVPLRAATWWTTPAIPNTTASKHIACWDPSLSKPGAVTIAHTGTWKGQPLGLNGGPQMDANHAKIGVSTDPARPYVIFGDMNQQGALSGNCASSQNGRGGLFFIVTDSALQASVAQLIGATSPSGGSGTGHH